jgi:serine/threonine-protein kinase
MPGAFFCDACGASATPQGAVARKLRQSSFDTVVDAKEGILSAGERLRGKHTYVVEEAIARSGFGATFRATRLGDEKQVLIKQMMDQAGYDQFKAELMKSFKREAKFLRRIRHPAFPRGHEYFEKHRSFFLVMDFINGKELGKAVDEHRAKYGQVEDGLLVHVGMEVADAIDVVHQHGYIYRDLKPANVMLDGVGGRVKLIDFGTLYHPSDTNPLLFESEGYTPPDFLVAGQRLLPSGDIYMLGALLFELAVGETPPKTGDGKLKDPARDPRLIAIIEKCLAKDPLARYQRARQVRDELAKLTRKGIWPFRNKNAIAPVELSVLPKTLYPSSSTFCEFCGYADAASQFGYCPSCRVPLRVGRLSIRNAKGETLKEFFLYADETLVGSASQSHFTVSDPNANVGNKHFRVFRRKTGLWLEVLEKNHEKTLLNQRRVLGPVELLDDDTIQIDGLQLKFHLRDAC